MTRECSRSGLSLCVGILSTFILTLASVALAGPWPEDGRLVVRGQDPLSMSNAGGTTVCSNGSGGSIVAYKSGADAAFIQSQAVGTPSLWDEGLVQTISSTCPGPPNVTSDRRGGAWVAWYDDRVGASGLYVQHFSADGTPYYSSFGAQVAGGANSDPFGDKIAVATTPAGDLLVAWQGTGNSEGVWVQRFVFNGNFVSTGPFAKVSTDASVARIQVVADGEGALVVWSGARDGDQGIWANRVESDGTRLWGIEGRQVMNRGFGTSPKQHTIDWNGTSLFVSWSFQPTASSGLRDVYAQRMSGSGAMLWGSAAFGLRVLTAPFTPGITSSPQIDVRPQVVADASGGCIIVWRDVREFFLVAPGESVRQDVDIYGQRLSVSGTPLWDTNGQAIDANPGTQKEACLVPDDAGGAIVVYMSYANLTRDIWARRIGPAGNRIWDRRPAETAGEQQAPSVASDGAGGFVAAWEDGRHVDVGDEAIYVTHFDNGGTPIVPTLAFTSPVHDLVAYSGKVTRVEWTSNLSGLYLLELVPSGQAATIIATVDLDRGSFDWTVPATPVTSARLSLRSGAGDLERESPVPFPICRRPFTTGFSSRNFQGAKDLAVGDFDSDGALDVVVAGTNGLTVAEGRSDGAFPTRSIVQTASEPAAVVVEDFDEDGILDLAVAMPGQIEIHLGLGSGTSGDGTFARLVGYPTGTDPRDLAVADLDEDGIADLIVVDGKDDLVSIWFGRESGGVGTGLFTGPRELPTSAGPRRVVAADFNGDDVLDLAVTCETAERFDILIALTSNGQGTGEFQTTSAGHPTPQPYGLAAGDFDEDGNVDLVMGNALASIAVSRGNGDGTFTAPLRFDGESGNRDLVLGDFTGDGRTDVAVAATSFNQISLYAGTGTGNTGDGGFVFVDSYPTGSIPEAIVVADFDGDDRPDLVTANRGTDNVLSVLSGPPDCQFAATGILLRRPEGGEAWPLGVRREILWDAGPGIVAVDVEVSRDQGVIWERIARRVTGDHLDWLVTGPTSGKSFVRVVDSNVASRGDQNDQVFEIADTVTDAPPANGAARTHALHPAAPNPFNPRTVFRFDVPRRERVSIRVYDVAGRLVRTLVDTVWYEAGTHAATWNGLDDGGRGVGSGVYLVQLRAGEFTATRRAALVR